MSEKIHAIAHQLLGKPSVDDCTLEELQHLAKRYPYFAPAQFLLLQKLKSADAADYQKQQQKAVLYYHDPLQFEYFISSDRFYIDEASLAETAPFAPTAIPAETETLSAPLDSEEQSLLRQAEATDALEAPAPLPFLSENSTEADTILPAIADEPRNEQPTIVGEELKEDNVSVRDDEKEALTIAESELPAAVDTEPPTVDLQSSESSSNTAASGTLVSDESVEETKQDVAGSDSMTTAASPDTNAELVFEPFHTVDYFASQGIKITADDLPKDKLSKQLRSFTEWLKIMKRLPVADLTQSTQSTAEKSVENMAHHSVTGGDVVTETMAEVWAKQGASEKAIETYNKLSLLNPSKKAYFAAKIENLKGS